MEEKLSLSQIGLYNPQRVDDDVAQALFVVRMKEFDFLMGRIAKENKESIPQHQLIIAQRGMGKTTLLKRIEVELRKEEYKQSFVPLLFPEEQYNIKNISEFWLNSLDALADTLELEKYVDEVKIIDKEVEQLMAIKDTDELGKKAFQFLKSFSASLGRRPVLLVDNINLIFSRLKKDDQFVLRGWLMEKGAPVIIGASTALPNDTVDYQAPFYDAFQMHYLKKLRFEELIDLLKNLAKLTQSEEVIPEIQKQLARLRTLHELTGGNPRTAVMLFRLIVKGFSQEINEDLEAILDEATPIYKARFEELPEQMQVIVDAIALNWAPINLGELRERTRYESNQLSPQLKRLTDIGWIEKINVSQAKGNAYQISERFFNIWFLMRRSSRRQKKEVYCLSKFLETFYGEDLQSVASNYLQVKATCSDHILYKFALAEALKEKGDLGIQLKEKAYRELEEFAEADPAILERFGVSLEEIRESIKQTGLLKEDEFYSWFGLGVTYLTSEKYDEAIDSFNKAITIEEDDSFSWYCLGLSYENLEKYNEAEQAYKKAIALDDNIFPKYDLVFLYRDKLNRVKEAEELFDTIELGDNSIDSYWLNKSLFELYKRNEGIATDSLMKALEVVKNGFNENTQDDWWRFGGVVVKLGYGDWFLSILENNGFDIVLSPYYVAIKAMGEKEPEAYLNSKAVELREPARKLMKIMKKYSTPVIND